MAIDVSSEPVFLSKKRRIITDVSSGLIFLKKKNGNYKGFRVSVSGMVSKTNIRIRVAPSVLII